MVMYDYKYISVEWNEYVLSFKLLCYIIGNKLSLYDNYLVFFFFKQKTAYEMRISDWSSDVCSSDLILRGDKTAIIHAASKAEQAFNYMIRSEERRVGKECVSTCRSRWSKYL